MPEFEPSLFGQVKELLSFLDAVWGVGGALVVIALFMYRRIRRDRAVTSAKIQQLSSQIGEIGDVVKNLEAENTRLTDELTQMRSRDFEHTLTVSKQASSLSGQHVAALSLGNCFVLNSASLVGISLALARLHLEAFYSTRDFAQLKESDRFASIAVLVLPASPEARALKAEVTIAIASNGSATDTGRPPDDLWDEALELLRDSEPGTDDEERFDALQRLGTRLREEGQYELAGAALRAAYRAAERAFGATSIQTLAALNNVATNFNDRGLPAAAKPLFQQLVERQQCAAGHLDEQTYRFMLAATACDRQLSGEQTVLASLEALVKDGKDRFGPENRWVLKAQNSLAVCLAVVGRDAEAEQLYRDTIDRETRLFGPNHDNPLSTRTNLARLLLKVGRTHHAVAEMADVAQRRLELHGANHPFALEAQHELAHMQMLNSAGSGYRNDA